MRYLGHQFERQFRQERLAHYRRLPGFSHLATPPEEQTAQLAQFFLDTNRTISQASEPDGEGRVEVRIVGPLDDFLGFEPNGIIEQLDARQADIRHIHLVINSPGGFIELSQTLYSDLRRRARQGVQVTSEGLALVASAAFDLFLVGDERTASDETIFMQHPIHGAHILIGTRSEMDQQHAENMSQMDAFIAQNYRIVQERTGQPEETLNQWLLEPGEVWFSVEQAFEHGITTQEPENLEQSAEPPAVQQQANRLWDYALSLTQ